jgi:hypothetical protein
MRSLCSPRAPRLLCGRRGCHLDHPCWTVAEPIRPVDSPQLLRALVRLSMQEVLLCGTVVLFGGTEVVALTWWRAVACNGNLPRGSR